MTTSNSAANVSPHRAPQPTAPNKFLWDARKQHAPLKVTFTDGEILFPCQLIDLDSTNLLVEVGGKKQVLNRPLIRRIDLFKGGESK